MRRSIVNDWIFQATKACSKSEESFRVVEKRTDVEAVLSSSLRLIEYDIRWEIAFYT